MVDWKGMFSKDEGRRNDAWLGGAQRLFDPGGIFGDGQQGKMPERDAQIMEQQQANLANLSSWADGTAGPSAAEQQLALGAGQASRQAMGMAAAQRGVSPAMAARLAQQQGMEGRARANEQAGILRAQEQANAMGMYQQALAGMSQDDLARLQAEAQLAGGNANLRQVHQGGILSAVGGLIGGLI